MKGERRGKGLLSAIQKYGFINVTLNQSWWRGGRALAPAVRIPTRDYDIDQLEFEITCRNSNSRAPGSSCAPFDIKASETL